MSKDSAQKEGKVDEVHYCRYTLHNNHGLLLKEDDLYLTISHLKQM